MLSKQSFTDKFLGVQQIQQWVSIFAQRRGENNHLNIVSNGNGLLIVDKQNCVNCLPRSGWQVVQ